MTIGFEMLKAAGLLAVIMGVWLCVQRSWRVVFPSTNGDDDALAGRTDCHGCSCDTPCENKTRAMRQERTDRIH